MQLRDIRLTLYTAVAAVLVLIAFLSLGHRPSLQDIGINKPTTPTKPSYVPRPSASHAPVLDEESATAVPPKGTKERFAYVTWLSSTVAKDGNPDNLEDDVYFIATRILVWGLLHNPKTKANGIDVIVAVTPDVSESRRNRLRKDGAIVRGIDFVHGENDEWLHPKENRWNDIMSKLRVWQFTEYSRILMIDGDVILQHPLDGIFDDPGAQIMETLQNVTRKDDEPDLPSEYMLGSIGEVAGADHKYPPTWDGGLKKPGYFCAGFFLLKPSTQLFEYYTALLSIPNRFSPEYMEQNLLNYAHRWDGPMPWKEIAYTWNIRSVNDNDLDKGVASMHEKWWEQPFSNSDRVKGIFLQNRWQMEGYYQARDQLQGLTDK